MCLDLIGGDLTNGNKIFVWDCNGHASQRWQLFNDQIVSLKDVNKCIDLPGSDLTNGNQLQIWDCNNGANQKWGYDVSDNTIYLSALGVKTYATKCMDLTGGQMAKGTPVEIWDCNGAANQKWFAQPPQGSTWVTDDLNDKISQGTKGVYTGGKGIIVRNPMDGYEDSKHWNVVPSTLLSNDIYTPTSLFPTVPAAGGGDPDCPNQGSNGYYPLSACSQDTRTQETGPWNYATVAYIIGDKMSVLFDQFDNIQDSNWGNGVFYPTDSNSVDSRCRWVPKYSGYDCPGGWIDWSSPQIGKFAKAEKYGAGAYDAGNPGPGEGPDSGLGGGAGCHFDLGWSNIIDQTNAQLKLNLVRNKHCECEYDFKANWGDWVDQWVEHGTNVKALDGWFKPGHKAPGQGLDQVSCWMNNPRDMINLQNNLYWKRLKWSN